jgi:hypothetical protein
LDNHTEPKKAGDSFKAIIEMSLINKLSTMDFQVEFDQTLIDFEEYNVNNVFELELVKTHIENPGVIDIGLVNTEGKYTGDFSGDLLTLTFKALNEGTSELVFVPGEFFLDDEELLNVEQEWINAGFEIVKDETGVKIVMKFRIEAA